MNELQIFKNEQFGEIRTIEENGKVLFCGSDVTKALGYKINFLFSSICKGITFRYTLAVGRKRFTRIFIS